MSKLKNILLKKGLIRPYFKETLTRGEYKAVTVNYDNLYKVIMEDTRARMCLYNEEARFLIVGVKGMQALENMEREMVINMPSTVLRGNRGSVEIWGLRVLIVPHFEGVLVLPEIQGYDAKPLSQQELHEKRRREEERISNYARDLRPWMYNPATKETRRED